VLIVTGCATGSCLQAQTSEPKKGAAAPATTVRPLQVDLLSLQVSKLPRDGFGHGVRPVTNQPVMTWLANSGTAVDLVIKLDRPIARFDETASRFLRFADDKGSDLTNPPGGRAVHVNTFFDDNKPIRVMIGPTLDEAEVILHGFGTPAPGATRLQIQADL